MGNIIEILRDPVWQGVGVIVTVLFGFLGFYVATKQVNWLYLLGGTIFLLIGLTIGVTLQQQRPNCCLPTPQPLTPIQQIDFEYHDSPTNHGWFFIDANSPPVVFEHINNPFVGSAINISSPIKYGIDFNLNPTASQLGNTIEFVADMQADAAIYILVVLNRNTDTTTGWLKFKQAEGKILPEPLNIGTGMGIDEWLVYVTPALSRGNNWLVFQVNVPDSVNNTFGKDGWHFSALKKVRLRGNLSLDYITVFQKPPTADETVK